MVASNHVLALAAAFAGAVPTVLAGTLVEAVQLPDIIEYTPTVVRRATTVDPYAGYSVRPLYVLKPLPANPSCTQNNCWRAFLNARSGSSGFHCPSTAFDYCSQWWTLNPSEKTYIVTQGILYHFLPWTANCGAAGPFETPADIAKIPDVVKDVDNVCACTLTHKVSVSTPNDYAALNPLTLNNPVCRQNL